MAALLASHNFYFRNHVELSRGRTVHKDLIRFSASVLVRNTLKFERQMLTLPATTKSFKVHVEVRQADQSNARPIKMVPTSELMRRKTLSMEGLDQGVNGTTKQAVSGTGAVERYNTGLGVLVRTAKSIRDSKEFLPFMKKAIKVYMSDEGFSWAKDNYRSWQRTVIVWSIVLSLNLRLLLENTQWAYVGGFTEVKQKERRRRTASWLRECALHLGPAYIKLGQLFSTRPDLFPPEYLDELSKLQDRVPAFSSKKVRELIESEFGTPVDVLFWDFEDQPIAAASVGQVHRAILHNGEKVVVKVQRPGLEKLFDTDLGTLKLIMEYFERSGIIGGPNRDWIGIYEEYSALLYKETDYMNEGKNADRFRRDFRNVKWIRVPLVFWDYTTSKVLTLEYVPGIKINQLDAIDSRGFSRSRISSCAIKAYLIQILKTGFFHADPHPGNLAIDVDEALIYYDFGMMGEINSFTQERLLELFYAVYRKDVKKVMQSLIDLEALQPSGDLTEVKRSVQFFLNNLLRKTPDQKETMAAIGEDLFAIATDQLLQLPSTLAFVVKAFTTLEGIGFTLDPDFSFAKIAAPYAQELLAKMQQQSSGTQLLVEIRKQADNVTTDTMSMPYRIHQIEKFVEQLELGDLKLQARVLESERAAQKATILQMATMYAVLSGTLLNLAAMFCNQVIANAFLFGAGIFFTLLISSMQRVKLLDLTNLGK